MKNKEIEKVHKFFNEPGEWKDGFYIMLPRFKRFDPIICNDYGKCYELALKPINQLAIYNFNAK
jgi:hypothetical protein